MTDFELLNDYASNHSEQAFGTLVERYANLVFSAALRQVQNAHDAEEIAQAVFIILARKAGTLGKDIILSGWLLRTTRFVVMNARRRQFHRSRAELEAASLQLCETENAWHQIAPLIDEALVSLNETDRNALTLRFFEEKSFKEIGALLHLSDDAAQKRVSRALGRLRDAFTRRGVVLPAALVSAAMATKAVQAAPSHLLALIPSGVNAGTGQAMLLAESALRALERMRLRTFGLGTTGVTLILLLLLALVHQFRSRDSSAVRPLPRAEAPVSGPPAATPPVRPATGIQAPIPSTRRQLLVRVLDADSGSPLAKTQVTSIWSAFPEGSTNVFQTDAKGEALLSFPSSSERVWCLRITALKDGFVPRFVNWAAERGDLLEELPAEYNLGLAGGLTMGGVVVDEGGQPAPEVTVTLNAGVDKTIIESSPEREGLTFTHVEVTDAQGRWVCNHAPQSIAALRCRVSHPDFVAADYPCSALGTTSNGLLRLSERDFRSQSAVMVLKAGAVLSGVVLDDQGNPVAGAKVTQNRDWGNVEANQFTRADGSFRFGNLGEGPWVVTAQADGFMGTDQTVPVGKQAEPCRFVLERAGRLQGRVEDDLGNPIANASLYATESSDRERFESVICTDAAGRFEWRSAPLTPCRYNIDAYGFKSRRAELLVPDGTERIVVLERAPIPRPARISGTVLDAETHQPIRSFEVWSAVTYRQQFASGSSQSVGMASELKTTGTNGTFAFLLLARGRSVESCDVEIKANGYLPGRETIRGSGTNGAHVTLALKPKVNLAGSVKLPNGEPVAGTVVLLCAEETSDLAYMRRPGQFDLKLSRGPHAATDARGQFTLPRPRSGGTLFVAHSLGYAELRLGHSDTAPTLILKPWGRVTGTLKLGNRLATNAAVSLDTLFYNGQRPALQVHLVSNTDQEGHFVIEGVPPGEWKVSPHGSYLQLRAGETARLALGGGGCTVVGRFTAPDRSPATNSQGLVVALETQLPDLAQPNRSQFASEAEYAAAKDNWLRRKSLFLLSDPGRQALRERREYVTQLDQNGAFKFEGALPGNYELRFRTDPLRQDLALIETYDAATRQVVVPEPENPDVATLDLGELLLPTSQRTVHQDFALPRR